MTREGSLSEGLSTWGWTVGTAVGNCLKILGVGRLSPRWAAPFPRQGGSDPVLEWRNQTEHKQQMSMRAFVFSALACR